MSHDPTDHAPDEHRSSDGDTGHGGGPEIRGTAPDEDLVDEGTKELAADEADRHEDAAEAQEADAAEGGYGH